MTSLRLIPPDEPAMPPFSLPVADDGLESEPWDVNTPSDRATHTLRPAVIDGSIADPAGASVVRIDFSRQLEPPRLMTTEQSAPDDTGMAGPAHWASYGKCRGMNVELFFGSHADEIATAKAVCRRCVVRRPCLEEALTNPGLRGVWGGTSETERRALRHQG